MRRRLLILLVSLMLCVAFSAPALGANANSNTYFGYLEGFLQTEAFSIQDAVSAGDLQNLPTGNALSPIVVVPAKWSAGWMDSARESWLKASIQWKTSRGVESCYFEVRYNGEEYYISRYDTMVDHDKELYKNR